MNTAFGIPFGIVAPLHIHSVDEPIMIFLGERMKTNNEAKEEDGEGAHAGCVKFPTNLSKSLAFVQLYLRKHL